MNRCISTKFDPSATYVVSRDESSNVITESRSSNIITESQSSDRISEGQSSVISSEREGEECSDSHLKKLQELKEECFQKIIDRKLLKICIDNICFSEFLQKEFLSSTKKNGHDDSTRLREKNYIKRLLIQKEALQADASMISKENSKLETQILRKKLYSRDCLRRRKKLWNEAVKMYAFNSGKLTHLDYLDCSMVSADSSTVNNTKQAIEDQLKTAILGIASKFARIIHLSRTLHNLICFSGLPWAHDKNLLETVVCTGQILRMKSSGENQEEIKEAIDNIIYKLNKIKM